MATAYGYARVSSRDQNLNRQLDALSAYGVGPENIFADHAAARTSTARAIVSCCAR